MTAARKLALALAIVALTQTGVLASMVVGRLVLIKTGREITLPIVPVDPRDLFRGEYVRLGYDIARVPVRVMEGAPPPAGDPFYVLIEKGADGAWAPVRASRTMPAQETAPDRIWLKARARWGWPRAAAASAIVWVNYGIESYFVPEGQGLRLEKLAREKKMATLVAVDSKGNAAIKGLVIEGVLQHEEPLF